ncbi:hypothetical protein KSC_110060 [Ktedonobacter sp. SOSP1-52]|uniref:hypothetical protein n=1 Tax=Ktedonobacter sp. SOSP1-52 TaxID=2778366 RepID=UPI001916C754|nr:hypothetical protein [Ktedonobacter sp. SOSP1-52]GHO72114.1 hypothetical protein KSC_110060 [Ktedonobacter sp. SOSP1-52]
MILPPGNCPVCKRNDQVQKVPAIHRNSSFTRMEPQVSTSVTVTYDAAGNPTYTSVPQTTTVPVTHQTRLGALLSPPQCKRIPLPAGEKIIFWLCPLFAFVFYFGLMSFLERIFPHALDAFVAFSSLGACLLLPLIFGGILIGPPLLLAFLTHNVFFRQANKRRHELQRQERERWQYLVRQWEQFCYCHRCDCVFSASSEKIAAPAQIQQLYRQ